MKKSLLAIFLLLTALCLSIAVFAELPAPYLGYGSDSTSGTTIDGIYVEAQTSGAQWYLFYRSTDGEHFAKVKQSSMWMWVDTDVEVNLTYYYYYTTMTDGVESDPSAIASFTNTACPKAPVLQSITLVGGKPQLTRTAEDAMEGDCYVIFRGTSADELSGVGQTTDLTFTDTTAKSGNTYYYAVGVARGDAFPRIGNQLEITLPEAETPSAPYAGHGTNSSIAAGIVMEGVYLEAERQNAEYYRFYRSTNGVFYTLAVETHQNMCIDTDVQDGRTYYYYYTTMTDGVESDPSATATYTFAAQRTPAPDCGRFADDNTVTGIFTQGVYVYTSVMADGYRFYRYDGKSVALIAETTESAYEDADVEDGKTYYYCYSTVTDGVESDRSAAAKYTFVKAPIPPRITSLELQDGMPLLTWETEDIESGDCYKIFRGETAEKSTCIATVDDLFYLDTDAQYGKTYFYSVATLRSDNPSLTREPQSITIPFPDIPQTGDVTGDGKLGLADVLRVLRYTADTSIPLDTWQADLNRDGEVDLADALLLLRMVLNG